MKSFRFLCVLAFTTLLPVATAYGADAQPVAAASAQKATTAKPPAGVDVYSSTAIGNGQTCQAGAKSDEDGMNERPVVYLAKAGGGYAWHAQLRIPKDMYQGRATHCVAAADALYVLVQIDTQSEQSTSQTLLQVVELNRKNGAVMAFKTIEVPGATGAYSAWVDDGSEHFALDGAKLVLKGSYQRLADRDDPAGKAPTDFTVAIPASLRP